MRRVTREFEEADRYLYDWGLCNTAHGFAQVDTSEDASYLGHWICPEKRLLFSYIEGDCVTEECDTDAEFVEAVRESVAWHRSYDSFLGVDPMGSEAIEARLRDMGLGDLLH